MSTDTPWGCLGGRLMKQKFSVTGMTCSACSSHVEKAVRKVNGVADVSVNLLNNSMTVQYENQSKEKEVVS